jgi:hypothetical protein
MTGLMIDRLWHIPREGELLDCPTLRIELISVERSAVTMLGLIPK